MRTLVLFTILSVAAARPGGIISPWGGSAYTPQYSVAQPVYSAPVLHSAPAVSYAQPLLHAAPVAVAKPAATSYASFQQVIHPVSIGQPVVHQPIVQAVHAQPLIQAQPLVQYAQPVVHAPVAQSVVHTHSQVVAQPVLQKYLSVGSGYDVGHGLGAGYGLGHGW